MTAFRPCYGLAGRRQDAGPSAFNGMVYKARRSMAMASDMCMGDMVYYKAWRSMAMASDMCMGAGRW